MDKKYIIAIVILIIIIIMVTTKSVKGLVDNFKIRGVDKFGSGKFGAQRRKSTGEVYTHQGIDILTYSGQAIKAPFDLQFIRVADPYPNDKTLKGGIWKSGNLELKIFYMIPNTNQKTFKKGEIIGYAQNLNDKYGEGIGNHIHLEIRENGNLINPEKYV
jgi:hypothetical protein